MSSISHEVFWLRMRMLQANRINSASSDTAHIQLVTLPSHSYILQPYSEPQWNPEQLRAVFRQFRPSLSILKITILNKPTGISGLGGIGELNVTVVGFSCGSASSSLGVFCAEVSQHQQSSLLKPGSKNYNIITQQVEQTAVVS